MNFYVLWYSTLGFICQFSDAYGLSVAAAALALAGIVFTALVYVLTVSFSSTKYPCLFVED
jgi:hypothetical protein